MVNVGKLFTFVSKRFLRKRRNDERRENVAQRLKRDFTPTEAVHKPLHFRKFRVVKVLLLHAREIARIPLAEKAGISILSCGSGRVFAIFTQRKRPWPRSTICDSDPIEALR